MSDPTRAEKIVGNLLVVCIDAGLKVNDAVLVQHATTANVLPSPSIIARARALLGSEWKPIDSAPEVAGRIEVRSIVTYRWLPYKPQSEQFKRGIKGRWQFPSDYGGWTNAELPSNAEWRLSPPSSGASDG